MNKSGSSILVFLLCMPLFVILAINLFKAVSYTLLIMNARVAPKVERNLVEGLLEIGVVLCRDNKEALLKKSKETHRSEIIFNSWPLAKTDAKLGNYGGKIFIEACPPNIHIDAHVMRGTETLKSGSCLLVVSKSIAKSLIVKNVKLN